jgi:cyanophycinase
VVSEGINVEVVGTGLVVILEGFKILEANIDDFGKQKPVTIRNLRMHLLSSGDAYTITQINPPHK